jgi:hypothetical protein
VSFSKEPARFPSPGLVIMGLYESRHSALLPDLPILSQADEDLRKSLETLDSMGGDTRWTKSSEKLDNYVG